MEEKDKWTLIISSVGVLINIVTLVVIYIYTHETRKMQVAVTKQAAVTNRQVSLSIMPAFIVQHIRQGNNERFVLTNIGNGSAVAIRLEPLELKPLIPDIISLVTIKFAPINLLGKDQSTDLTLTFYYDGERQPSPTYQFLHEIPSREEGVYRNPLRSFGLRVSFADIEGTRYIQELLMSKDGCIPGPVKPSGETANLDQA